MVSKKRSMFIGALFLVVLFLGIISAESCDIRLRTDCQGGQWNNILMGLSNSTNAHGELFTQEYYEYVLCCDFERTTVCGANKIIGLSDITNAHAEIPDAIPQEYTENICYGTFNCRSTTENCEFNEMGVFSLTDETNAHIGGFGDYGIKICCQGICESGEEYVEGNCIETTDKYWANQNRQYIIEIHADVGTTTVLMIIEDSGLDPGTNVTFEIYENDLFLFYNKIRVGDEAIVGIVDSSGTAIANWTILESDLEKTGDYEEFYFEVDGQKSNYLEVIVVECNTINYCWDYEETECNSDTCEVSGNSLEGINCDDPFIECGCQWNEEENKCSPAWRIVEEFYCGYCGDSMVNLSWETCDDGNSGDEDGCSSGCQIEGLAGEYCGDGEINLDWEVCDDGNNGDGDGCSSGCQVEGLTGEYCGDGEVNLDWETCDDGNSADGDGCSTGCLDEEISCDDIEIPSGDGGTCLITEITDDDCEDGFITYSWEGTWTGEQEGSDYETCIAGGERTVPCPAEIQLPFFGIYNFVITFMLIALIYVFVIFRKKH